MSSNRAVIDQPGLRILLIGLIISLFIGLVVRSQLRPSKIAERIYPFISQLNTSDPASVVDFERAEVRLSDWGLPRPFLIIHNLRYSKNINSCRSEQIQIHQVAIPIPIKFLFSRDLILKTVSFSNVEWRLPRTDDCELKTEILSKPSNENESASGNNLEVEEVSAIYYRHFQNIHNIVENLRIDRFRIIHPSDSSKNFELRNVAMNMSQNDSQSRGIVSAQLFAAPDRQTHSLLFRSDVSGEVVFYPADLKRSTFQIAFDGRLIDRPVQLKMIYNPESNSLDVKGRVQSILIRRLISLYQQLPANLDWMRQLNDFALSGEIDFSFSLIKKNWTRQLISNVSLKFGESSIELSDADLLKWLGTQRFQLTLVAAQVELRHFLKSLQKGLGQIHILNPGVFSGLIELSNFGDLQTSGVIRNVEFEFSNRAQKKLQIIDSMNARLSYSEGKTNIKISDLTIGSRRVTGSIQLKLDESNQTKKLEIQGELKGPILSPESWGFLTGKEQDLELLLRFKILPDGTEAIHIQSEKLDLYGFEFEKPSIDVLYDQQLRPKMVKGSIKGIEAIESFDDSDEKPLQFLFVNQLAKDLEVLPPVKALGVEFQYLFEPSFQLQINSFTSPKFLRSVKQVGKRKSSGIWTIETNVRSDSGQKTLIYDLDFSIEKFSKTILKPEN